MGGLGGRSVAGQPRRTRREFLKHAAYASAGITTAVALASLRSPFVAESLGPRRIFDVTAAPFRARGDGIHDDRAAIQAAIEAAHDAGGGTVWLPAGSYFLASVQEEPGFRFYLLDMHSSVTVRGAGAGQTVLRAGPGMPDQTRIISTDARLHVANIGFAGFSLDGNADNQPDAASMVGISCDGTSGAVHEGVLVHDVKGTGNGEGTCFDSYGASGSRYVQCEAARNGTGTTGSGFSATQASDIAYADCRASGSTHWQGFTTYLSRDIRYLRCFGFRNLQRGLNCEQSTNVLYVDCLAGGAGYGNHGDGFCLFRSSGVTVDRCRSLANLNGLNNNGSANVRVAGGQFSQNHVAGLAFATREDFAGSEITDGPDLLANQLGAFVVAGNFYDKLS
jgi:hypothetical protein